MASISTATNHDAAIPITITITITITIITRHHNKRLNLKMRHN